MKRRLFIFFFVGLIPLFILFGFGPTKHSHIASSPNARLQIDSNYGKLPLAFEPNQGQTDSQVQYLSHGDGYTLFLTSGEAVLVLHKPQPNAHSKFSRSKEKRKGGKVSASSAPVSQTPPVALRMKLEDTQTGASFEGTEQLPGISNYLIGNDRSKWHTNIPQYSKVQAGEVYPGVDMVYYGNQRHLEYDFVVKPGADPNSIHLSYEGAKSSNVNAQGDLELQIEGGKVTFRSPTVYQETYGQRTEVEGHYRMEQDGGIRFDVKDYDKTKPLVIDPVLDYSTYLGGNYFDYGQGIAVDGSGDAYVTGQTGSTNFPTTSGAFQTNGPNGGVWNVFVTMLNPEGTAPVYSTFFGGNNYDYAYAIAVDKSGHAYVTGFTTSADFPTTSGVFQTNLKGIQNVFVTELNSGGTAPVYSTYLGGENSDQGNGIVVDGSGDAYVTGDTTSTLFPTTSGTFQTTLNGYLNIFVTKLNPGGTALVYSTYLGGNGGDFGNAIAVDGSGEAYVTGTTDSENFPITSGAYQTSLNGNQNVIVTKLNPGGTALVYSTYLGGTLTDQGNGIAVDGSGDAYVTGYASSANFPTTSGAYQTSLNGTQNVFVTELNFGGTAPVYSTFLGGNAVDQGNGIAVDGSGDAYVTGNTTSTNFPTTSGAFQAELGSGGSSAFTTELNPGGTEPVYSTYLGADNTDQGNGIAVDGSGNVYVAGDTYSTLFPATSGAYQTNDPESGYEHAFVTKFDTSVFYTPTYNPTFSPTQTPTTAATPQFTSTYTMTQTTTVTPTTTGCAIVSFCGANTSTFWSPITAVGGTTVVGFIGSFGPIAPMDPCMPPIFQVNSIVFNVGTYDNGMTPNNLSTEIKQVQLWCNGVLGGVSPFSNPLVMTGHPLMVGYPGIYTTAANYTLEFVLSPIATGMIETSFPSLNPPEISGYSVSGFNPVVYNCESMSQTIGYAIVNPAITATSTTTIASTLTNTSTPTWTPSPTMTSIYSPTFTLTTTPTQTTTFSSTSTISWTPTVSWTWTDSPTFSWTPSITQTPTITLTPTVTETFTDSPTFTPTFTWTWTGTPTDSPTITLSPTVTLSPTITATTVFIGQSAVAYPNPVTSGNQVAVAIPALGTGPMKVKIRIYSLAMRKVSEENFTGVMPGQTVMVRLIDAAGRNLSNGLYYVKVTTPYGQSVTKLLILY